MTSKILVAPTFISTESILSIDDSPRDFSRYDAFLDDLGVIYHGDPDLKAGTATLPLRPERQDVGNNPFEQRPEFGDYFSQGDFSGGALQTYFHRNNRDPHAYLRSEGFDISEPGILRHLNQTLEADDTNLTDPGALAQVDSKPFVIDGTSVWRGNGSFPGTWTEEDPHDGEGAVDGEDLAASGSELYAALGVNGIHVRDAAGVWSHYVTAGATGIDRVAWAKDRLFCSDGRNIYEITASGALPTAIETLALGWAFEDIFEAGPFVFACAVNRELGASRVHAYGLNSGATAIEKKTSTALPKGDVVQAGIGYLGKVYLGGGRATSAGGYDPIIYEAAPSDGGDLTLLLITEGEASGAADLSVTALESVPDTVLFGWSLESGDPAGERCGLAAHNLARRAFYKHLSAAVGAARINGIMLFNGRVLFTVDGEGLFYEDLGTPVAQATLETSIADWNSTGRKIWDLIEVLHAPLIVGTSVEIQYSKKHPDEGDWESAFVSYLPGSQGLAERLEDITSRILAVRLVSNADQTNDPEIRSFSVRSNPSPATTEFSLTRYVRLLSSDRKDGKGEAIKQDPRARRRAIQDLAYTWVTLYEPGFTWKAWVQSVADAQPALPVISETGGDASKEAYVMELRLVASREG